MAGGQDSGGQACGRGLLWRQRCSAPSWPEDSLASCSSAQLLNGSSKNKRNFKKIFQGLFLVDPVIPIAFCISLTFLGLLYQASD